MELEQPSLPGVPKMLRRDCLPTKRDIFDHYLYMRKARQESGEWKQNTPLSIAVGRSLLMSGSSGTRQEFLTFLVGGKERRTLPAS